VLLAWLPLEIARPGLLKYARSAIEQKLAAQSPDFTA
jgi:hypothetical protein